MYNNNNNNNNNNKSDNDNDIKTKASSVVSEGRQHGVLITFQVRKSMTFHHKQTDIEYQQTPNATCRCTYCFMYCTCRLHVCKTYLLKNFQDLKKIAPLSKMPQVIEATDLDIISKQSNQGWLHTFFHSSHNGRKVIIQQDHVGCLFGHIRAGNTHSNT